ncbi:PREDICTED: taxadien-5-alpha-ol O-acetyltransferase-like [Tarenaya hassleriana]|uniref:taxadien-5-alpha-ol O-acetyltransferase-like n=1 Tax=Tarenaya hassleriana TaxID=28532 RepID=UPI00053CA21F|nr:PREDICTED: taxadien-5-alpha-ol O-acetyltransferase-like [Tarenaya hassleriana]
MGSSVHVKDATVVTPSDPTPSSVLSLSALDSQLFLRFTIEYLFVYRPRPGSDPVSLTGRVKSALSRSLVPYFPFAGRVRERSDGSGLEVLCRGQGALFLEAVSDNLTCHDFQRAPRHVTSWRKLLSLNVGDVLAGGPPLVVQLTWLRDGGAALAFGINHCVSDGIGSSEFLNLFAELSRNWPCHTEMKRKHVWDRHLLDPSPWKPPPPGCDSLSHPEFNRAPDLCGFLNRFSAERLAPTCVVFARQQLVELKKLASRLSELKPTSFEVLSAHVWRSWARSLNLPSKQTLKLLFSINVRDRVKPNLPNGFYGNAFVVGCAQTTVKDLTEKGLGHATMLVKRAKERVDDEYVKSVVEAVSKARASPDSVGVLILSQWSRLGLERLDFSLGKPVHVGSVCCDRYCLLLPVPDQNDAVKVMVAVPSSAVNAYDNLMTSPDS